MTVHHLLHSEIYFVCYSAGGFKAATKITFSTTTTNAGVTTICPKRKDYVIRHMEVPRPGVESEVQLLATAIATATSTATATWDLSCVCDLHHSSRPHQIHNPLSKARD